MIKVIVFDAGGVLIRFNLKRLARQYARALKLDPVLIQNAWVISIPDVESSRITVKQFYDRFCGRLNLKPDYTLLNSVFNKHFTLNRSVFRLSQELKAHYKVGLLSNADPRFYKVIKNLLGKSYDFDIISYKIGFIKPEKEIYARLIKRAGCRPDEIVFIDDYHSFIEAARKAGINGIVFRNLTQLKLELRKLGIR